MSIRRFWPELFGMSLYMTDDQEYFYAWGWAGAVRRRPGRALYVVDVYGLAHHVAGTANATEQARSASPGSAGEEKNE